MTAENLEHEMILDAYYDPIGNIWRVEGGYLYRTVEQLNKELADAFRWTIQREMYSHYMREHPLYCLTGA